MSGIRAAAVWLLFLILTGSSGLARAPIVGDDVAGGGTGRARRSAMEYIEAGIGFLHLIDWWMCEKPTDERTILLPNRSKLVRMPVVGARSICLCASMLVEETGNRASLS